MTNIGELLNTANEADAQESAKKRAERAAADEAVRARTAPAIADVRWTIPLLEAHREHRPGVQAQVTKWAKHRVAGQSRWLEHARDFLQYTDPAAPDYMGLGSLERLIAKLEACNSETPRAQIDGLVQIARYAREWPGAAASALEAFVIDLPAVEASEQKRLEIESRYAAIGGGR